MDSELRAASLNLDFRRVTEGGQRLDIRPECLTYSQIKPCRFRH